MKSVRHRTATKLIDQALSLDKLFADDSEIIAIKSRSKKIRAQHLRHRLRNLSYEMRSVARDLIKE